MPTIAAAAPLPVRYRTTLPSRLKSAGLILLTLLLVGASGTVCAKKGKSAPPSDWDRLAPKAVMADFQCTALYTNGRNEVIGARFDHQPSGFVLDVLRLETAPQSFVYVNTPPVSDRGEPHTLEHLLLGKGTKGQYVATLEEMSLGESSAYTEQLKTCYHFSARGGTESFYLLFQEKLDAMLHPTFSDEEIRREVANVGYAAEQDGSLRLEEKGTVYNEMVSGFERPYGNLYYTLNKLMFGEKNPQAYDAGGYPPALRTMQPADIRAFHGATHHLNNMVGAVVVPSGIPLGDLLTRLSATLKAVEPNCPRAAHSPADAWAAIPPDQSASGGTKQIVAFPASSNEEPGLLVMGYPPTGPVTIDELLRRDIFLDALCNGVTANLYTLFVNSSTRAIDLGSPSVGSYTDELPGYPFYITVDNIEARRVSEGTIDSVRAIIMKECARLAALSADSPELAAFNERVEGRLLQKRRDLLNTLNTPPGWGRRGSGSRIPDLLRRLHQSGGDRRDITFTGALDAFAADLKKKENLWTGMVSRWKLDSFAPIAVASRPDVPLGQTNESDRQQRLAAFTENLEKKYGVTDKKAALERFRQSYDSGTAVIAGELAGQKSPQFLSNPPLGIDDVLPWRIDSLPGGKPLVVSSFSNITSATFGLAFDMSVVPESLLVYAAALPQLITEFGCTKDNKLYSQEEMNQALDHQIMELSAYFDMNYRTERCELVVRAAGNNAEESKKALEWLAAVLKSPNLSAANLPHIRDVIQQEFMNQRGRLRGSEESWVNAPANGYWRQENPLLLMTGTFFTRAYGLFRLKWQLAEAATSDEKTGTLATLGGYNGLPSLYRQRDSMIAALNREATGEKPLGKQMREDLRLLAADLPPLQYDRDWSYLVNAMAADLDVPATTVLNRLGMLLDLLRHRDNVRAFAVLNPTDEKTMLPALRGIVLEMKTEPSVHPMYKRTPRITQNMQARYPGTEPVFAGLVNNGTRSGIHYNTADCASFIDNDTSGLIDFLTARLYGGHGAHSMFMQTWGAGLAYSNGLRSNELSGRMIYYAERCPDLAQTMQFVVKTLKDAPYDSTLADYAVAQAFAVMRTADDYPSRGERMAADLADGNTPQRVTEFRRRILELRNRPGLYDQLYKRMSAVYGLILPDYGPGGAEAVKTARAKYLVMGPDTQLDTYEKYLKQVEGPETMLYRIYPSDYWLRDLMLIE